LHRELLSSAPCFVLCGEESLNLPVNIRELHPRRAQDPDTSLFHLRFRSDGKHDNKDLNGHDKITTALHYISSPSCSKNTVTCSALLPVRRFVLRALVDRVLREPLLLLSHQLDIGAPLRRPTTKIPRQSHYFTIVTLSAVVSNSAPGGICIASITRTHTSLANTPDHLCFIPLCRLPAGQLQAPVASSTHRAARRAATPGYVTQAEQTSIRCLRCEHPGPSNCLWRCETWGDPQLPSALPASFPVLTPSPQSHLDGVEGGVKS
jgi:hypothetical protein